MTTSRALADELEVWRMAWQQVETFVDRIDGVARQDELHAKRYYALLSIAAVIEAHRARRGDKALGAPLAGAPRGRGMKPFGGSLEVGAIEARLPGPEDLEGAVFMLEVQGGVVAKTSLLPASLELFKVVDEQTGKIVAYSVPTYDFGPLGTNEQIVASTGPFNKAKRENAARRVLSTEVNLKEWDLERWSEVRQRRRDKLSKAVTDCLAPGKGHLGALENKVNKGQGDAELQSKVAGIADSASRAARKDAATLASLKLEELGLETLRARLQTASLGLTAAADAYGALHDLLRETTNKLTKERLRPALDALELSELDKVLTALDAVAVGKTSEEEEEGLLDLVANARAAYPDGPLRLLRALEWMLHTHWRQQLRWYEFRQPSILTPLFYAALRPFLQSLTSVLSGNATNFPHQLSIGEPVSYQSTTIVVHDEQGKGPKLGAIVPGHAVVVGGPRPTLAVVLGRDEGPSGETRLVVTPMHLSLAVDPSLPGVTGLIQAGVSVDGGPASVTMDALRHGRVLGHPERDALPQAIVRFWGQLALLLGTEELQNRNVPTLWIPSERSLDLPVTGSFGNGDSQLLLENLPAAFLDAKGQQRVARPAELLLLEGEDANGLVWQGVIEVAAVDVRKASEIDPDEPVATPCGDPGESVVVLTVQDAWFPERLETKLRIHRDFMGFGRASLATGVLLPEGVDKDRRTHAGITGTNFEQAVNRHPELIAARRVLERWIGSVR